MMKYILSITLVIIGVGTYFINNTLRGSVPLSSIQATVSASPKPSAKAPSPKNSPVSTPLVRLTHEVPFMSQSPFAQWSDPRQQDGCEEASVLMAIHWVWGDISVPKEQALRELLELSKFSEENYGTYHDTSSAVTVNFFKDRFEHSGAVRKTVSSSADIIREIGNGNVVIVPANGRRLGNPFFTAPGPEYHMLLIKGFDDVTKEFITNDPGLSTRGVSYRYSYQTLFSAIADYETGYHLPRTEISKMMIVVSK